MICPTFRIFYVLETPFADAEVQRMVSINTRNADGHLIESSTTSIGFIDDLIESKYIYLYLILRNFCSDLENVKTDNP